MCGLAGFAGGPPLEDAVPRLDAAASALRHRGPDDRGTWWDADAPVGLAHVRLAVVDTSTAGAQPMHSADGRWVIAYNGEIYNHAAVRADLVAAGFDRPFRGHSDTETLVEACARFGVENAVRRCAGMFAFALWDRHERTLYLGRDRLGIKPLYWGHDGGRCVFASELKGLLPLLGRRPALDPDALDEFLRYGFIPAPRSIYAGIAKLAPGTLLVVPPGASAEARAYWRLEDAVCQAHTAAAADAVEEMEALLASVVREHMLSDVPLGAFLSGGVDSSLVTALMQKAGSAPVRTFSIGFAEASHDESRHAAAVARHLGTAHTALTVTPAEALAVVADLPGVYDEPFADSSQVPTLLLARLARQHVTVALSGDGGDETFAGYTRHALAGALVAPALGLPLALRRAAARGMEWVGPRRWQALASALPQGVRPRQVPDKMNRLAAVLRGGDDGLYASLLANWPDSPARGVPRPGFGDAGVLASLSRTGERLQYQDAAVYLPDDGLVKVDRATMAASLECRVPLLDHRVVEAAWRLPWSLRVRGCSGKWIARQVLARHVPRVLFERPKSGFAVPLAAWLRGGLRDWADGLLAPATLAAAGVPEPGVARQLWDEHLAGRADRHHALWNLLSFLAWHERWA